MKRLLSLFLVLLTLRSASAQQPAILVDHDGKMESLGLVRLEIDVHIVGFIAETSATMTFANPSGTATEGDLYFPVPEGATVSGYALDIKGQMVDGVSVEKTYAREVFEAELHRRVDPGPGRVDQGKLLPHSRLSNTGPRSTTHRAGQVPQRTGR